MPAGAGVALAPVVLFPVVVAVGLRERQPVLAQQGVEGALELAEQGGGVAPGAEARGGLVGGAGERLGRELGRDVARTPATVPS